MSKIKPPTIKGLIRCIRDYAGENRGLRDAAIRIVIDNAAFFGDLLAGRKSDFSFSDSPSTPTVFRVGYYLSKKDGILPTDYTDQDRKMLKLARMDQANIISHAIDSIKSQTLVREERSTPSLKRKKSKDGPRTPLYKAVKRALKENLEGKALWTRVQGLAMEDDKIKPIPEWERLFWPGDFAKAYKDGAWTRKLTYYVSNVRRSLSRSLK